MTLTRGPCELDNMSLFQDLKLKRRKVDSRCSSDGESVADTSTSSPDAGPPSPAPKMADADRTSPAATGQQAPAPVRPARNSTPWPRVYDGGGEGAPPRPPSAPPAPLAPLAPQPQHRQMGVIRSVGCHGETSEVLHRDIYRELKIDASQQQLHEQTSNANVLRETYAYLAGGALRVKCEQPPTVSASQQTHQQYRDLKTDSPQQQQAHVVRGENEQPNNANAGVLRETYAYLPGGALRVKCEQPPPVSVAQPTSTASRSPQQYRSAGVISSPRPPASPHSPLWSHGSRINGVKPELIGGHFPATQLDKRPQWRSAPAVIMGESGGVRTMFWAPPNPPAAAESAAGTSQAPSHSPPSRAPTPYDQGAQRLPCAEESAAAAQLLLSLGQQERWPSQPKDPTRPPGPALNMELLWAGDVSQLPANQQLHALNLSAQAHHAALARTAPDRPPYSHEAGEPDEDEQPMICMICEDKATGLHYGIITCEGCKGFFKRTVQNRRVYTCVADGNCEITKAQRNRCQYCRFKKCIEQGMVLQAVREDRMPGGRNSGAVYNLYKVKYKKHKKSGQRANQAKLGPGPDRQAIALGPSQALKTESPVSLPPHLVNGTILKTALTNPSEVLHLRQRLDSTVSSSRDRAVPLDHALQMIRALIDCDAMEDIATVRHLPDLFEDKSEIGDKLLKIGDSIVHKMVAWTRKLPFILEIPMEIHSKLLMDKWHEISVLTTAAYQAMHGKTSAPQSDHEQEFLQEVNANLRTLQGCLTTLMGRSITMDQLRIDVGLVVEKMTQITITFRRIQLRMEEYVCLKVYILLNQEVELESIQDRYVQVLRSYLEHTSPHHPGRIHELFARIPEIQAAANLLLESKMFYVPFVLNSAEIR